MFKLSNIEDLLKLGIIKLNDKKHDTKMYKIPALKYLHIKRLTAIKTNTK